LFQNVPHIRYRVDAEQQHHQVEDGFYQHQILRLAVPYFKEIQTGKEKQNKRYAYALRYL
jgi:hypothetical protein